MKHLPAPLSLAKRTLFLTLILFGASLILPPKVLAIARWGPHIACYASAEMMSRVRSEYNRAGTTDWIPATIIVTSDVDAGIISQVLNDAFQYKIIPIFRLEGPGFSGPLTADEARRAAQAISQAAGGGPSFPRKIYVEVGNEPNLWENWGMCLEKITNYNESLSAFLDASAGAVGVLNAASDISNPTSNLCSPSGVPEGIPGMLDAVEFWGGFPPETLRRLNGVAFNPYELGGGGRYSINAWSWERDNLLVPRGAPGGPVFLLEFGLGPDRPAQERLNFLIEQYQRNAHQVEAITPLVILHDQGGIYKIPIFGPNGVWFIDPIGPGVSCGAGTGPNICGGAVPGQDSRPAPCDACNLTALMTPACATAPTVSSTVRWQRWEPGPENLCTDGRAFVRREWGGTITLDGSNTTIPFVGAKGLESEERYLTDYFEGTALYYRQVSPSEPTYKEFTGVFRKLAPHLIQNRLKKEMVRRAILSRAGTIPNAIHDYTVSNVVFRRRLSEFAGHFPPDPAVDPAAYEAWRNSEWGQLWPYVPMFSREDTPGDVIPYLGARINDTFTILQIEDPPEQLPHVARMFELSTQIQDTLLPEGM